MSIDVIRYYSDARVAEEIAGFLRQRWAALEGSSRKWVRWLGESPLRITAPSDVPSLVRRFHRIRPRTFYGTIEVFKRLVHRSDVEEQYVTNVERASMFIDIDIVDDSAIDNNWRYAIRAAEIIVEELASLGIEKSVYLVWSGAGVHVRVSEKAFHRALRAAHPVDAAFALAELVLSRVKQELVEVVKNSGGLVKIENLVSPKRVFTAPLSLHRRLNRVAVAFHPSEIRDFDISWSEPGNYTHRLRAWDRGVEGEADEAALEALRLVNSRYPWLTRSTRIEQPPPSTDKDMARKSAENTRGKGYAREPGRFPVMALLQAARYYLLTGDEKRAKSFGLNRAIFYAWAKYYGPHSARARTTARRYSSGRLIGKDEAKWVEIGGEKVMISPRGYFVIGGVEQTPEDFDKYVARKIEEAGIDFEEAWKAAIEYLKRFPRNVLRDPQRFYHEVYEPVRDRFVEKVLHRRQQRRERGLDVWLRGGGAGNSKT